MIPPPIFSHTSSDGIRTEVDRMETDEIILSVCGPDIEDRAHRVVLPDGAWEAMRAGPVSRVVLIGDRAPAREMVG